MLWLHLMQPNSRSASSCKAKHIFIRKSVVLHICEGPDLGSVTDRIEEKRRKLSTWQDWNPRPLCHKACALPLCCSCYCSFDWFGIKSKLVFISTASFRYELIANSNRHKGKSAQEWITQILTRPCKFNWRAFRHLLMVMRPKVFVS